jgi:hypothetical protein
MDDLFYWAVFLRYGAPTASPLTESVQAHRSATLWVQAPRAEPSAGRALG